MGLKDELEVDIARALEHLEKQSINGQKETLRNLLNKYIHLGTTDYMMDNHDLLTIISNAKGIFAREKMPIHLGSKKRKVSQQDLPNLCVIEATVAYLNKNDCLKKLAKFDKREDKF